MSNQTLSRVLIAIVAVVLLYGLYALLNAPDRRTTTERVGDAIHDLPQGVDKAARQLEDRTPGEKVGDAVKDAGQKIKEETR